MDIVKHAASLLFAGSLFLISCNDTSETSVKGSSGDNNRTLSEREEDFLEDIAEMNTVEIAYLNAGIAFATDLEIKALAAELLTDHVAMDKQLKDIASKKNTTLPTIDSTVVVLDLPNKKGLDWDKAWADEMVDEHKRLVRKFERNEKRVKDADLKNFIAQSLPNLHGHLETLKKAEDRVDQLD